MKKRLLSALTALVIVGAVAFAAFASGTAGTASDPLVSLSHLNGTVKNEILASVNTAPLTAAYDSAVSKISGQTAATDYSFASGYTQQRLKNGDVLTGKLGMSVTLLAGSASVSFASGAVVDISEGSAVSSGALMTANHRYFVADEGAASFIITSDTAVVQYEGGYKLGYSSRTDYNQLATALNTMGLFKGDGTGFGSGYALERDATRLEGLIMFLRLLGEETQALNTTASNPFTDVPNWAAKYVAYAYEKGYTKGTGGNKFSPNDTLTAQHYITFLLRALGYSEDTDFTWTGAMDSARTLGLINTAEQTLLSSGFGRARCVYLSYFALSKPLKGSGTTLLSKLTGSGAVNPAVASAAVAAVTTGRII